jgi:hypothetical protein
MKFRLSSSGCETRPVRGEPARAGSEPGDGLGNEIGEACKSSGYFGLGTAIARRRFLTPQSVS